MSGPLVFTCYIRANIGCGHGGWKNELIEGFDERIFSIIISTCTLTFGRATISATDFGRDKMNFKIFKKLLGMLLFIKIMGPIIYFSHGRSLSRHKHSFFI